MMDQLTGEWQYMGTEVTDKNGKLQFTIPSEKSLPQGMHPVKVVVRYLFVYSNQVARYLICLSCTCNFDDLASLQVIIARPSLTCVYI